MTRSNKEYEAALAHFGVKGMHWGVRKDRTAAEQELHDKHVRNAKIALGTAAGVALVAAGTYYAYKHGAFSSSSFSSAEKSLGKHTVETLLQSSEHEPTGIVHGTGAGYLADRMHRRGGITDIFSEFQKAGLANEHAELVPAGHYRRYGKNLEKVAVSFADPYGRKDFSGRPITHHVVLPSHHAHDVTDFNSAQKKAWKLLEESYNRFSEYANKKGATNAEARRLGLMD